MTSKLERQWWYSLPIGALAAILTLYVLRSAGIKHPYTASQWLLYMMCFIGFQRGISFIGWLVVFSVSPRNKMLENTR
jgi:hypothetical protein